LLGSLLFTFALVAQASSADASARPNSQLGVSDSQHKRDFVQGAGVVGSVFTSPDYQYRPPVVVYVPAPATASVSEWSKPATYTSLFALCVSLCVAGYTFWKDHRARKHSVEDDYWLRKVIGPIAIEPLLKSVLEMIATAPADYSSADFSEQAITDFHKSHVKKLSELAVNASSFQLLDASLASTTAAAIDQIQDLMIEFCSQNMNMCKTGQRLQGYEKHNFQTQAQSELVSLLRPIREYQVRR
jgi:hypothetical protein